MRKTVIAFAALIFMSAIQARADEGMWLLPLIEKLAIKDMKKAGFKLSAKQIYDINSSSMKDAVVYFGGGCTGEMISDQGLLLTNHHCGFGAIQYHSSLEHDYLKHGFVAMGKEEELYTPDLTVMFLERIVDVSDSIYPILQECKNEEERENKETELLAKIKNESAYAENTNYKIIVTPMFGGNSYYLCEYKVYRDVRMVFAPPSSIGKFGGKTDNWMWPRHTGDFSVFRIYGDADGNPADYSLSNIPVKPKHHFPISLDGYKEGDFAMVMGYPASTNRYMSSREVLERVVENDTRICIRGMRQELMLADMQNDPKIYIQYASKYNSSSNYWKNSIGMNKAISKLDITGRKKIKESTFTQWLNADSERQKLYAEALPLIESAVEGRQQSGKAQLFINESIFKGIELAGFGKSFIPLYEMLKSEKIDSAAYVKVIHDLEKLSKNFFKNFNKSTDMTIAENMLRLYADSVAKAYRFDIIDSVNKIYHGSMEDYCYNLYNNSFLLNYSKIADFLSNPSLAQLECDLGFRLPLSADKKYKELQDSKTKYDNDLKKGKRLYIAGLQEMEKGKKNFYPDANATMRLSFGKVKGYEPADGKYYQYITTLKGVMEKKVPGNWEFEVPDKLSSLYAQKDYGEYADKDGRMPVNFIFDGDITGGNSGSPVINAKGQLIGTAFDGNWEAMSGDLTFETQLQRCINLDIRYTLFVIDKFGGAGYLLKEMSIVK